MLAPRRRSSLPSRPRPPESCAVVKGARFPGAIERLVSHLRPAVEASLALPGDPVENALHLIEMVRR